MMELFEKKERHRVRGTLKVKTSPQSQNMRERLKLRLPRKNSRVRGTLKVKTSPCCGEDITPTGINKVPPHGVTGVGEGRA